MNCKYCNYFGANHSDDCPALFAPGEEMENWQRGYDDARAGARKDVLLEFDAQYDLGFTRGTASLEEAQNGSRW